MCSGMMENAGEACVAETEVPGEALDTVWVHEVAK